MKHPLILTTIDLISYHSPMIKYFFITPTFFDVTTTKAEVFVLIFTT